MARRLPTLPGFATDYSGRYTRHSEIAGAPGLSGPTVRMGDHPAEATRKRPKTWSRGLWGGLWGLNGD